MPVLAACIPGPGLNVGRVGVEQAVDEVVQVAQLEAFRHCYALSFEAVAAGCEQERRHMHHFVVKRMSVAEHAVLEELFAVVRSDQQPRGINPFEQFRKLGREHGVEFLKFGAVGLAQGAFALVAGLGGRVVGSGQVRFVRIEQLDVEEPLT